MAGEINFGAIDPMAPYKGAAATNALLKGFAQFRAGRALASGQPDAARDELYKAGDIAGGAEVQKQHWSEDDRVKKLSLEQQKQSAEFTAEASSALYTHLQQHKTDADGGVGATLQGFDQLAPILQRKGAQPQDVAMFREQLAKDPEGFLKMMHAHASEAMKKYVVGPGAKLADETGAVLTDNPVVPKPAPPIIKEVKDGDGTPRIVQIDPATGQPAAAAPGTPPPVAAPTQPAFEDLAGAVMSQESGGQAGAIGPATAYGHAQGNMQTLPDTAKSMAAKLGIEWKPELLAAKTPEAAAYQQQLGKAYLQEGLDKYQGDPRQALMYYYGGPDEKLWGPKTHAYADQVLARLKPSQVAALGDAGVGASNPAVRELWHGIATPPKPDKAASSPVKLSQSDSAYMAKMRTGADELQNTVSALDEFLVRNKKVKTGGIMATPGVGTVLAAVNNDVSRMISITSRLTPAMRNGLPGAASDRDVAMFKSSTVSIDKPYESNVANVKAAKALANRVGDHVAFMEAYANKNGSILGASELWKQYVDDHPLYAGEDKNGVIKMNKVTPWRQAIPLGPANSAPASRERTYDPTTGTFH